MGDLVAHKHFGLAAVSWNPDHMTYMVRHWCGLSPIQWCDNTSELYNRAIGIDRESSLLFLIRVSTGYEPLFLYFELGQVPSDHRHRPQIWPTPKWKESKKTVSSEERSTLLVRSVNLSVRQRPMRSWTISPARRSSLLSQRRKTTSASLQK